MLYRDFADLRPDRVRAIAIRQLSPTEQILAHGTIMEDMAIMRSMRDRANRIRNCDTANIKRTLKVAEEQTALALEIRDAGLIERLPPALRQLVEARLGNPEASLAELGEGLSPPITKSTVKYRWQRLSGYAETLTARQDGIEAEGKEKGTLGGVEGETENVRS